MTQTRRLSREEKKAVTRARLIDAARVVFARHGFTKASVDQIAEEAGFSKGAVYSNFDSKEDLFLALMDEHIERHRTEMAEEIGKEETFEGRATVAGAQFMDMLRDEREYMLLFMEFAAYAARNPELRPKVASRIQRFQDTIGELIDDWRRKNNVPAVLPVEKAALTIMAMGHGLALQDLVDPDSVPDDLYGEAMTLFFRGAIERTLEVMAEGGPVIEP